jgi:FXSXX-COOH protein
MTTTDVLMSPAPSAPVFSVLADLGHTSLREMRSAEAVTLGETVDRAVPAPETPQVPVAAFNSGI